ncbi:MAG: hypothetical protein J0L57_06315 [Burkholderiales bacterium]|nr:hypothetical protein [Burkholderiales bacterium]
MTPNTSLHANPFALLMDPEAVFRAIAKSERLVRLQSRICRPLDKPLLPPAEGGEGGPAVDPHQDLPGSPC